MDWFRRIQRAAQLRVLASVCVVFLLSLAITSAGVWVIRANDGRVAAAGLDQRAALAGAAVRGELDRYEVAVAAIAAALSAQTELNRHDFDVITAPLLEAGLGGASAIMFVVPANDAEVVATQRYWRAHGAAGLTLVDEGPGDEHLFSIFSRSLDGVQSMSGRDLTASAPAAAALADARRSGQVTVSDTYVLLKDRSLPANLQQHSFILAAEVSDSTTRVRGWALMSLRAGSLLSDTTASIGQRAVNTTLTTTGADGRPVTVVRQRSGTASNPDLVRIERIQVAQQTWTLRIEGTDAAAARDTGGATNALAVALGGFIISLLLASVAYLELVTRRRALQAVAVATKHLKTTESEARKQAALFTAVLESISDGVILMDENGEVVIHNLAAVAIAGPSVDPARWKQDLTVLCPDGVTPFPMAQSPSARALRGEVSTNVELVIRANGTGIGTPVSVSARPLDPSAGIRGGVSIFRDISARLLVEDELRAASEQLRFAFEHAHVGMTMTDLSTDPPRIIRVNDALCTMLGYTDRELLERSFQDITHPDDRDTGATLVEDVIAGRGDSPTLERRCLHADGHVIWVEVKSSIIRDAGGAAKLAIAQIEDITERRAATERLTALTLQDALTGIGNRVLFGDRMTQAVARTARSNRSLAVIFCDLDGFKPVNDSKGHAAGDAVLREVALRLRDAVRPADTVARFGGDEFAVLCEDLDGPETAAVVAERIRTALGQPYTLKDGAVVRIGCSIGIATADGQGIDATELLQRADSAMYAAKRTAKQEARSHQESDARPVPR